MLRGCFLLSFRASSQVVEFDLDLELDFKSLKKIADLIGFFSPICMEDLKSKIWIGFLDFIQLWPNASMFVISEF